MHAANNRMFKAKKCCIKTGVVYFVSIEGAIQRSENEKHKMKYRIYESTTGNLIGEVEVDQAEMENVSSDNAEGHFEADRLAEVEAVAGNRIVYALLA